jgi:two-component system, OmpR family, response regulator
MEIRKILVVENDRDFGAMLKRYLLKNGFEVTLIQSGMEGFQEFKKTPYDLCIIDTNMPYKDGYTLAKEIHDRTTEIPIIFLLGKYMSEEALNVHKRESDDFLNKPFDPDFLLAKIKTIMQRKGLQKKKEEHNNEFKIGEFNFNTKLRLLSLSGQEPIKLSPKENELLKMLSLHENDLLTRQLALMKIWRQDDFYAARSMDVYIAKLRKHLKADQNVEIQNIPCKGFMLVTETTGV